MPRSKKKTDSTRPALGELQLEVMQLTWERGELSVRDVHEILQRSRPIAYTTVMTVMTRLAARKLLLRRREGASYLYRPALSRDDLAGEAISSILARLAGGIGTPVLAQFVDAVEERSPEKLEELARMIEEKRRGKRR